jgi:hypothetical protein
LVFLLGTKSKKFFFEKRTKKLSCPARACGREAQEVKVFCFFFKKELLA